MTNEQFEKRMEFIIEHQARFASDIQRLEEAQARTEQAVAQTEQIVARLANVTAEGFKDGNAKMDALVELSWRVYPVSAMTAIGATLLSLGSRTAWRGLGRPMSDATRVQTFVQGFRIAVIGATLAGLGASWNWHLTWLLVLSLVIGGEEVLESTTHLAILRWKPNVGTQKLAVLRRTTAA